MKILLHHNASELVEGLKIYFSQYVLEILERDF